MKNIVIIGAGPAGITAAYELLKLKDYNVTLLEESEVYGGISRTVMVDGNRMDIGGHRFFSKHSKVTKWWYHFLKPQGGPSKDAILLGQNQAYYKDGADPETEDLVMLTRRRVSRIYYKNKFFDYPVSLSAATIRNMGFITTLRAGFGYFLSLIKKLPDDNLENFYINRFGKPLYSMFFEGYTEKLWGRHPREISAEWGAQRIKGLSVKAIFKDIFAKLFKVKNRKVETSLIESFIYPKYGPGQLWTTVVNAITAMGGNVVTNKTAASLKRDNADNIQKVICADKSEYICDYLISSMPVKDLINALDDVPQEIAQIANGLPYRDFQTVGILLPVQKFLLKSDGKYKTVGGIAPDCWIYVQDTTVNLGRIQVFNNWSPYMVSDFEATVWLGLEYFCNEGDEYWNMPDDKFISFAADELVKIGVIKSVSDIISSHRERVKKAYPAYFDTYSEFDKLRAYLDKIPNLYCVGRNGQHRYNNMDHSMLTAFAAADCIHCGAADKTPVWNVNVEEEYHEVKSEGSSE